MPSARSSSPAAVSPVAAARPPVSLTRLIGRRQELEQLDRALDATRLLTLTGVGGGGKSRLAAEMSVRLSEKRDLPAAWIELGCCSAQIPVAQQAAAMFALRETSRGGATSALIELLHDREMLFVLDNCEHVIEQCAELATAVLTQCPRVTMITTSREPLGIAGERVWPVPPMALPDPEARDVQLIGASEAVELFVDRARGADPSFELTSGNVAAVADICRRLDGIPLAIELAAARVRLLTPEQIASRLTDRFAFLGGASRSGAARHRTLRATIDWSFTLLSEPEQRLFQRLAVFKGFFPLEAVECVCSDETLPRAQILDLLGGLVDKSLVVSSIGGGTARYSMLETIASYAAERLDSTPESHELRRRHALAYLAKAREGAPELTVGSTAQLECLDLERDNVRSALAWAIDNEPDSIGLPLAASLRWYWYYGFRWSEGVDSLSRALQRAKKELSHDRASALTGLGTLTAYLGDLGTARGLLSESEAMWRELGDERQLAFNLSATAQLLASVGDLDAATRYAPEAVALARKNGIAWDVGYCLTNAAAFVAQVRGDYVEADRHLEEAEKVWADSRHPLGFPFVLNARALLALTRNDHDAAARLARAALAETRDRRELWFSSRSFRILAFTSAGDPLRAARLLGAADAMLQTMTTGMLLHEKREHERLLAALNRELTSEVLEAAMREGRDLSYDDACDLAMQEPAPIVTASQPESAPILQVRDLGPLQITMEGKPLDGESRSSARARELLVFLLSDPHGRTKEEAGVALWPDASSEQVKNSFHVTLHRLRKLFGSREVIIADGGRYRIDPAFPFAVVSRQFETEVTSALRHTRLAELQAALALYAGDYLQGDDVGEWSIPIRSHLRQLFVRGLFELGQRLESRGRYDEATEAYRRVTAREPFQEAAWRQLMVCRARLGARSESLGIYRDLEQRLRTELQAQPEPDTVVLYRRLQQDERV